MKRFYVVESIWEEFGSQEKYINTFTNGKKAHKWAKECKDKEGHRVSKVYKCRGEVNWIYK